MAFQPFAYPLDSASVIEDVSGAKWAPLFRHDCTFDHDVFDKVMMNLIRNPNINSNWLFRADILLDLQHAALSQAVDGEVEPRLVNFRNLTLERVMIRKLIPRNTLRDKPLDQTCLIYEGQKQQGEPERSMVVYRPHIESEEDVPFYHPKVKGIAFLHEWFPERCQGIISVHYQFFESSEPSEKLVRTGFHLLATLHKHGEGTRSGYVKRVHHDAIIPQVALQTTYAQLKEKYARDLIKGWAESTDPSKHVFEDIAIASFLIELWGEMYKDTQFPGFVDIGCGNGLLVYLLNREGFRGWGFDARERKSWANYTIVPELPTEGQPLVNLQERVLVPSLIHTDETLSPEELKLVHNGEFPKGTFIVSNHADELTPWTPILAAASECPFIMIPCCSHDLTGAKFRAPSRKQQSRSESAYASLVTWVKEIAADCGWEIETEMLRIPSTRNTGLLGRSRTREYGEVDLPQLLSKYGGTGGYVANAMKLVKTNPRSH